MGNSKGKQRAPADSVSAPHVIGILADETVIHKAPVSDKSTLGEIVSSIRVNLQKHINTVFTLNKLVTLDSTNFTIPGLPDYAPEKSIGDLPNIPNPMAILFNPIKGDDKRITNSASEMAVNRIVSNIEELPQSQSRVNKLSAGLIRLAEEVSVLKDSNTTLKNETTASVEEKLDLRNENSSLQNEISALQNEISTLRTSNTALNEKVIASEEELQCHLSCLHKFDAAFY